MLGGSRAPYMCVCVCVCAEVYYKEVAQVMMEAELSPSLLSASCWYRKTGGIFPRPESWSQGVGSSPGLRTRRPRTGEDQCLSLSIQAELIQPSFAFLLCLGPQGIGCCSSNWGGPSCISQPTSSSANLSHNCSCRQTKKQCFTSYLGLPWPNQVDP